MATPALVLAPVFDCPGSPASWEGASASPKWVGNNQARIPAPHRRVLGWLVRRVIAINNRGKDQGCLPSGDSCDSLQELQEMHWRHQQQLGSQHPWQQPEKQRSEEQRPEEQRPEEQQRAEPQPADAAVAAEPEHPEQRPGWRCLAKAVLRPIVHVLRMCTQMDPGNNDHTMLERVTNVITSVPFMVVGMRGLRQRKCPKGRHLCWAFMAVGAVASLYHGVGLHSPVRPVMRKLDYWTICYTSNVLRRAAHIPLPRAVQLAALLVAPWKPTAVTGLNLALVESKYVQTALSHASLRPSLRLHFTTAAAGLVCFAFEDVASGAGWPPVLHSLWHCLSTVAMSCTNGLLQHLEMLLLVEGMQADGR